MKSFKLLSGSVSMALLIGTLAHADVVTDWNTAALDAIRDGHTAPPVASRSLAILHVSIHDAVNGIARTHEPYLVESAVPASASREAAASAAAHQALVNLFPARISTFDALHAAILAGIPDGPQKTAGISWGEFVANQILAAGQRWLRCHSSATWRQWSWRMGADSSGLSSLFVASVG